MSQEHEFQREVMPALTTPVTGQINKNYDESRAEWKRLLVEEKVAHQRSKTSLEKQVAELQVQDRQTVLVYITWQAQAHDLMVYIETQQKIEASGSKVGSRMKQRVSSCDAGGVPRRKGVRRGAPGASTPEED